MQFFSEYKRILIGNGPFHAFAHFTFCLVEGYWYCCLCMFAHWLGKKKDVYRQMKDLQHDNAKHALDFHRVCSAGILAYLLLDVTSPPPALLVRDPQGYLGAVDSASGESCTRDVVAPLRLR